MCKNCVSGNPAVLKFDSFESFMEQAKAPGSYSSSHERGQASFYGTDSFEEAVKVASRGWPEGTAKVLKMRASIDGAVRSLVNARSSTYSYDMSGEFVDVGRFLSGEPECFGVEIQDFGNMSKPVIKMVVNLSASGSVSSESLFMRGVAVVAAIDILEAVGNRVEVWAATGTSSGSKGQVLEVHALIKQANQPMNIDRLSFVIAHTAFFRRLMWAIQEQHNLHPNFTYPRAITSVKDGIVTDHSLTGTGLSKADLMRLIASVCQKAGVEIPKAEIDALIKAGSALP